MSVEAPSSGPADLARDHRAFLWSLCYRMTGSAADADDLAQETLLRAIERPPARTDEPMRPWLVRVAVNLSKDLLRRRKRRAYVGPWLPSPIETSDQEPAVWELGGEGGTEARYDLLESVSFAFLLALEALTPQQRAVLILRDVLDYSVRETAEAVGISEPNVKTTHHRARARMAAYDRERRVPTPELVAETRAALERFVTGLVLDDVAAMESTLLDSVQALTDGGGEFFAARVPVVGRDLVVKFFRNLVRRGGDGAQSAIITINGMPALVTERPPTEREAPLIVTRVEIAPDGRIAEIHSVLATRKLTALRR